MAVHRRKPYFSIRQGATPQDSDPDADNLAWKEFLGLLKGCAAGGRSVASFSR